VYSSELSKRLFLKMAKHAEKKEFVLVGGTRIVYPLVEAK